MTDTPAPTTALAERVRKIVTDFMVENCNADRAQVTDTANWRDEYGADSLDSVDLTMTLEDEFMIQLDDETMADVWTIADAIKAVEAKLIVAAA